MNEWAQRTLELATTQNYLDQLQHIYSHEEGEREVDDSAIEAIKQSFNAKDETKLMKQLLSLKKFPYKDSYVSFLRKDRTAIERNPETVRRICDRLYGMGVESVVSGIKMAKEANQRRGNSFTVWLRKNFNGVELREFKKSKEGIVILLGNETDARNFCNAELGIGISKRPDLVAKAGKHYVVGEAKFLSSLGGNQDRAFDDGIKLATNTEGIAYKVFVLDGVPWVERGSSQYKRIDHATAAIFSGLLLNDYLNSLL